MSDMELAYYKIKLFYDHSTECKLTSDVEYVKRIIRKLSSRSYILR